MSSTIDIKHLPYENHKEEIFSIDVLLFAPYKSFCVFLDKCINIFFGQTDGHGYCNDSPT